MIAPEDAMFEPVGAQGPGPALPGAVPSLFTSFLGRERELSDVAALLRRSRLVTLVGPGGTGKTRLAIALAEREQAAGIDVGFVDLAPVPEAHLVPAAIASSLGLRATARQPPLELIIRWVGARRFILVLDNLERLLQAASPIARLIADCPHLGVVSTSRIPLRLSMEQVYEVSPLPTPADHMELSDASLIPRDGAVALFMDRAGMDGESVDIAVVDLRHVAEICRRLDGLPLAIELAAARTRHLAPSAMVERLDTRLPLLTGGPTDAPERHRALRDTIAWSYDMLDPDTAAMFARSSVFVGSFGLTAATEVAGSAENVTEMATLDILSGLVDHSLLRRADAGGEEPRFAMLDTIREFAAELVDEDEESLRHRHALHYLAVAETAEALSDGPDQARATRMISVDIGNLRMALDWAVRAKEHEFLLRLAAALGDYWDYHGDLREGATWLDRATSGPDASATVVLAKAERHAGKIAFLLGHSKAARGRFERSLEISRQVHDLDGEAASLCGLGAILHLSDDHDSAGQWIEQGLAIAREHGAPGRIAYALRLLAILTMLRGDHEHSRRLYDEAIREANQGGNKREAGLSLVSRGAAWLSDGDPARAEESFSEGLELLQEVAAVGYLGWSALNRGLALVQLGDLEAAREQISTGTELSRRGAATQDLISALEVMAEWLGTASAAREAVIAWAAAEAARQRLEAPLPAHDHIWLDPGVARDRAALPAASREEAWESGRAAPLDTALDDAQAVLRRLPLEVPHGARSRTGRHELTPREQEVLALVAAGRSDGEIATELFISPKTASVHVANIKGKLEANSRVEIATRAIRLGLADSGAVDGDA